MRGLRAGLAMALAAAALSLLPGGGAFAAPEHDGGRLFRQHCAGCHPDGGNLAYPQKSLSRLVLRANGIVGVEGIVARMRRPGPGMPRFEKRDIPDRQARAIAEYILATFP